MLKVLRKKKVAKWGLISLTTVIIFAFVFWGSSSLLRDRSKETTLGTIFGKPVRADEFKNALLAARTLAVMRYGEKFAEVSDYLNLEAQAWERLVLLHEAARRRINISDREVVEEVQQYPFFQVEGVFDQNRYEQLTQYVFGTPKRVFEENIRDSLKIARLYEQVTDGLTVSDEELRGEYEKQNMQLSVTYLAAFPGDFSAGIEPDEAELRRHYDENSVSFKEPLSYKVRYISSPAKERIQEAYEQVRKSKDLIAAAAALGVEVEETDFFGEDDPIPGIGWDARVNALLSQMEANGSAIPFSDEDGTYYLLQLAERRPPYIPEFDAIKEKVKEFYIQAGSVKKARAAIEAAFEALSGRLKENPDQPLNLKGTASEFKLAYDTTDLFEYQSYIEGIGSSNAFWLAAKELEKPQISPIINAPSGFFIVTPEEKVPLDEEAFEKEKEEFKEEVLALRKQERFSVFLRGLSQSAGQ